MNISWSPLAVQRLEEIYAFIARDNQKAAAEMIENILSKVESLKSMPSRGRIVPEIKRKEIREIFEKSYRIIYRLDDTGISILTVRSFKQKLKNEL